MKSAGHVQKERPLSGGVPLFRVPPGFGRGDLTVGRPASPLAGHAVTLSSHSCLNYYGLRAIMGYP